MVKKYTQSPSPIFKQARRVIILLGVGIAFIELLVHYLQNGIHVDWYLFMEVGFYAIFVPLLGSLLLNYFQSIESGRLQAFDFLNHQLAVSRRFSKASKWNDLIWWVAEYPTTILPVHKVALYLQDSHQLSLELAAIWSSGQTDSADLGRSEKPHPCTVCQAGEVGFHRLVWSERSKDDQQTLYCLPIFLGETQLGLMQLTGKPELPENGLQILKNITPEIALAVDRARLQQVASSQAESNEEERKRIARDLHDTLGQSVAFLRMRLEHLSLSSDPARQISEIRNELELMRDTANEAYHHVRDTLADLRTDTGRDLRQALLEMSRKIAARSAIQIEVSQHGQPQILRPHTRREILYICREALYNIEKHANARQIMIELDWQLDEFTITIQDDGGGFVPEKVVGSQHYGLSIMRDRAEDIQASLKVESGLGQGTRITFRLPLECRVEKDKIFSENMTVPLSIQGSEPQDDEVAGR